jgi:hypothetical protein
MTTGDIYRVRGTYYDHTITKVVNNGEMKQDDFATQLLEANKKFASLDAEYNRLLLHYNTVVKELTEQIAAQRIILDANDELITRLKADIERLRGGIYCKEKVEELEVEIVIEEMKPQEVLPL